MEEGHFGREAGLPQAWGSRPSSDSDKSGFEWKGGVAAEIQVESTGVQTAAPSLHVRIALAGMLSEIKFLAACFDGRAQAPSASMITPTTHARRFSAAAGVMLPDDLAGLEDLERLT